MFQAWLQLDSRLQVVSQRDFTPYPTAADRAAWEGLDATWRADTVAAGEAALGEAWPAVTATQILHFVRDGSRDPHQEPVFKRRAILRSLMLAECVEGKGRFVDPLVDAIWSTCEESTWCWSAHLGVQTCGAGLPDVTDPTFDLGAGETASLLAWTCHLLRGALDGVSPLVADRIAMEIQGRILDPCLSGRVPGWMEADNPKRKFNNWTPWCVSNLLAAMLLIETDDARRAEAVRRAMAALERFVDDYGDDGGCDEGPAYWAVAAGRLLPCLELLRLGTGGAVNLLHEPKVQAMMRFVHHTWIGDGWYFNFNDGSARPPMGRVLLSNCARYTGCGELLSLFEAEASREKPLPRCPTLDLMYLFSPGGCAGIPGVAAGAEQTTFMPSIQCMTARTPSLFVGAKGAHNGESHNHNDVGNFIVFAGKRPLVIDVGVGVYTRKTFSRDRYDLWYMQSQWHNVPTVNGVMQPPGGDYAARDVRFEDDGNAATLHMDIAGAYPPEANLAAWRRSVTLDRDKAEVCIADRYELSGDVRDIAWHLLTPSRASVAGAGVLRLDAAPLSGDLRSAEGAIRFDPAWSVTIEPKPTDDMKLAGVWGDAVTRITLRLARPPRQGELTVRISAAASSTPSARP